MLTLNDAQVWAVIGVFAAALFSVVTLISTMFVRVLRAEIGRLDVKIDSLDDRMNTRFDAVNTRFDTLDRDVGVLFRRAFGGETD